VSAGDRQRVRACQRRFTKFYPGGFHDDDYLIMERGYKWEAHQRWNRALGRTQLRSLLDARAFEEIATTAVGIESRTNLLFSFEKMAICDASRSGTGADLVEPYGPVGRPTARCSISRQLFAPTWLNDMTPVQFVPIGARRTRVATRRRRRR